MDDGAGTAALDGLDPEMAHQAAAAGGDLFSVDFHDDAVAADLFHFADAGKVKLLSPGLPDADGDGVGRGRFRQGSIFQHGFPVQFAVVDIHDVEDAHGQGAGFVKDDGAGLRQRFQVIGSLDQNAGLARTADACKEAERDADDQRAGAADHQEGEGPVDPFAPVGRLAEDEPDQRRKGCQRGGADHHHRRVIPGEAGDEVLGTGFAGGSVFHQVQHLADGGLAEDLCGPDVQNAAHVDAAADHFVSRPHVPRHAFAGQGAGVQAGLAGLHDAVDRDLFPGVDDDDAADLHFIRIHADQLSVLLNVGVIRADIHQFADVPAAFTDGVALEQFADLVEQHDRNGLIIIPGLQQADGQRTQRRYGHEEVFVEHLAIQDALPGFLQDVISDDPVGNQPEQEQRNIADLHKLRQEMQEDHQHGGDDDADQHLLLLFGHIFHSFRRNLRITV